MAGFFDTIFKPVAGAGASLSQVAAVYAAKSASQQAATQVRTQSAVSRVQAAAGRSSVAAAAKQAEFWAAQQRAVAEAQRRVNEAARAERTKQAWARVNARGEKLIDLNAGNDRDADGFRWLTKPLNNQMPGLPGTLPFPSWNDNDPGSEVNALFRQQERDERQPAAQGLGLLPSVDSTPISGTVQAEGRPGPDDAVLAHRKGERAAPMAQKEVDKIVDPYLELTFDNDAGFPGAYKLWKTVRDTKDPEAIKYYEMYSDYQLWLARGPDAQIMDIPNPGGDGDFGFDSTLGGSNPYRIQGQGSRSFPYVLVKDQGTSDFELVHINFYFDNLNKQALINPERAGELIVTLAALGAYGGGSEKFAEDRVQVETDPKTGKRKITGIWSADDAAKLNAYLGQLAAFQQAHATNGRLEGIEQIMAEEALKRQELIATKGTGGNTGSDYGGGGYRRRGGGGYGGGGYGGGGGSSPIRYTAANTLRMFVDSISRQRMGQVLTDEQAAAFVAHYHQLEAKNSADYNAGTSFTALDPEAEAIAWLNSHFAKETGSQAYAGFAAALAQMAGGLPGVEGLE